MNQKNKVKPLVELTTFHRPRLKFNARRPVPFSLHTVRPAAPPGALPDYWMCGLCFVKGERKTPERLGSCSQFDWGRTAFRYLYRERKESKDVTSHERPKRDRVLRKHMSSQRKGRSGDTGAVVSGAVGFRGRASEQSCSWGLRSWPARRQQAGGTAGWRAATFFWVYVSKAIEIG